MFKFLFWISPCVLFYFMCYHGLFMYFKRTWNSLSRPIPIGGALHQSKQILWYSTVMQRALQLWLIRRQAEQFHSSASQSVLQHQGLLVGQGKATNFVSRSSCSHDTMFKKGSFSTQIIHPQLTESSPFRFGLLKLKWKHFVLASWAAASCSRSVQCSFASGPGASQPLQKVGCSTPKCFADCTPHLLWDFSFHIFPYILWETNELSGLFHPAWNKK